MPSSSLELWNTVGRRAVDQVHAAVRESEPVRQVRRTRIAALRQSFCVMLTSQFQAYCRNLHDECIVLVRDAAPSVGDLLEINLRYGRKLDQGNPNPGNIGSDFNRFGIQFWDAVKRLDPRNPDHLKTLIDLNDWRNAVAHQDFRRSLQPDGFIRLNTMRRWRLACDALARSFDTIMEGHLSTILQRSPW